MPDVPEEVLAAARWVAGYSTVPEPEEEEWGGEPHDVTQNPPRGLRPEWEEADVEGQAAAQAELWEETLSALEGSKRDWFRALLDSLNELARALDASVTRHRP